MRDLLAELQAEFGERNGRLRAIRARGRYPLIEQARDDVREHRVVHVGNAAQTLHPVAGQGLNLGVRDCVALADVIAAAAARGQDPLARPVRIRAVAPCRPTRHPDVDAHGSRDSSRRGSGRSRPPARWV